MAIYSVSVQTMSRSSGRSATAAAAYRSGSEIVDRNSGEVHNYKLKGERGVEKSGIILPDGSPENLNNREELWNEAENSENRKNSVVAREVLVAIPHELNKEQRAELVHEYSQSLSDRYKTGVDYSIHSPDKGSDDRNYHAHIMMTTRRIDEKGFGEKTRELDAYKSSGKMEINNIRQSWEERANKSLEKAGSKERIDSRSLKDQGINREPTQHVGVSGTAIERRGGFSERAEINKQIRELNKEKINLLTSLKQSHRERKEIQSQIDSIKLESKETFKELKQSERIEKAVDIAKAKTAEIHKERGDKTAQFFIDKSQKRVDAAERKVKDAVINSRNSFNRKDKAIADAKVKVLEEKLFKEQNRHEKIKHENSSEAHRKDAATERGNKALEKIDAEKPKARFWKSKETNNLNRDLWEIKRRTQETKNKEDLERVAPPIEKAKETALGKAAYQAKVKKEVIRENYDADNKTKTKEAEQKHQDTRAKLAQKIEEAKAKQEEIKADGAAVDAIKKKLAERKQALSDNENSIIKNDRGNKMADNVESKAKELIRIKQVKRDEKPKVVDPTKQTEPETDLNKRREKLREHMSQKDRIADKTPVKEKGKDEKSL